MDDSLPPSAAGPERLSKQLQAAAGRTSPSAGGATGANAAGTLAFIIAQNTISLDEITAHGDVKMAVADTDAVVPTTSQGWNCRLRINHAGRLRLFKHHNIYLKDENRQ